MTIHRAARSTWIFAALAALAACGNTNSPEQQVRAVIDQVEAAAESRDVGDLTAHISKDYQDSNGLGPEELARYLHGYFIANQSIHLVTRIEQIDFPTDDEARAQVLVGMVGREAAAPNQLDAGDLAADLHTFKIALRREDGAWKINFSEVVRK